MTLAAALEMDDMLDKIVEGKATGALVDYAAS